MRFCFEFLSAGRFPAFVSSPAQRPIFYFVFMKIGFLFYSLVGMLHPLPLGRWENGHSQLVERSSPPPVEDSVCLLDQATAPNDLESCAVIGFTANAISVCPKRRWPFPCYQC